MKPVRFITFLSLAIALAVVAAPAQAQDPCLQPDNGNGTVTLPPAGCDYLSPAQVHMIIDGLPAGTTIILKPIHMQIICRELGQCGDGSTKGSGTLGGEVERASSTLRLQMSGTGVLSGFNRVVDVPANFETHTAPRPLGDRVQTFETAMFDLRGEITGDPDFDFLHIEAGEANGLPSPGATTLVRQADGSFAVESGFKVNYRITFQGSDNGKLRGFGGTTEGTVEMQAGDLEAQVVDADANDSTN